MTDKEQEFYKKLLAAFRIEAAEHVNSLSSGLVALENARGAGEQKEIVELIFREAHSLKGAARSVNLPEIESVCQSLESTFASLKREEAAPSAELFDRVHQALDKLKEAITPPSKEPVPGSSSPPETPAETIRISTEKLSALFTHAEEMLSIRLRAVQHLNDLREFGRAFRAQRKNQGGLAGEPANIAVLDSRLQALEKHAAEDHRQATRMVDELLEQMKRVLMLPFSSVMESFPKFVRDLARDQGKEAEIVIHGGETEIDKRILEQMKDALMHLIRNCIDHGIEEPAERRRKGKPAKGSVTVSIGQRDDGKIEIEVSDDGQGIDIGRLRAAILRLELLPKHELDNMADGSLRSFIFHSGLSTKTRVTEISGRGIGLAIVKEKVDNLGGTIAVRSQADVETTFRILLPATLATFQGVLIHVDEQPFIFPAINVERVIRFKIADVKTVENRDMIVVSGKTVPLVELKSTLGLPQKTTRDSGWCTRPAILLDGPNGSAAFLVDEVLGFHDILLKNYGKTLSGVPFTGSAAILANGKPVPILKVSDLIKSAANAPHSLPTLQGPDREPEKQSVLVAEDSITSRMLLKNILESAGFRVKVAVDGADAFTALKSEHFDLLVSDIDMPRMSGLALTTKIRADRQLRELPVILVTALESREDRERGMEIGANAYIVKSSFDQTNLIDAVRRLI
jgi:two-component system chemotaxis sensor kinase CheA